MADASSPPGNVVTSTTVVFTVGGETFTTVHETTYSPSGYGLSDSEITTNAADEIVMSDVTTRTFGTDGRLLSSTQVVDSDGDGPGRPDTTVNTIFYDKTGFVTSVVITVDNDNDPDIDSTNTFSFGRDRKNRTTTFDATSAGDFGFTVHNETTYTARGDVVLDVTTTDFDHPDVPDTVATQTLTYNSKHQILTSLGVIETLNTTPSPAPSVTDVTNTYDSRGNRVQSTTVYDFDGVLGTDVRVTSTSTFDSKDRLVHRTTVTEDALQPTRTSLEDYTYDGAGRIVASSYQQFEGEVLVAQRRHLHLRQ